MYMCIHMSVLTRALSSIGQLHCTSTVYYVLGITVIWECKIVFETTVLYIIACLLSKDCLEKDTSQKSR